MPTHLLSTIYADGSRAPHYVNGRLLAAEDLLAEREATRRRLTWLGKASGHGVIEGLDVTRATNGLTVSAGLGITKQGHPISLAADVALSLSQLPEEEPTGQTGGDDEDTTPAVDLGVFAVCGFQPVSGVSSVPSGDYLLTVAPTIKFDGQAPVKATPGSTSPPACAFKWEIDGLQFKAIALIGFARDVQLANTNHRRNELAHWCFAGADPQFAALGDDPFTFGDAYGGLDDPTFADLTPCDLPLAVFQWDGGQLRFVDRWPVRRRLIRPFALTGWRGIVSDRREADGQARFLQFQDHIADLGALRTTAAETFRFLPPAGLIRINPVPLLDRIDALIEAGEVGTGKTPPIRVKEAWLDILLKTARQRDSAFDSYDFSNIQRAQRATEDPHVTDLKNLVYAVTTNLQAVKTELEFIKQNPNLKIPDDGEIGGEIPGLAVGADDDGAATPVETELPTATAAAEAETQRQQYLADLRDWLRGMTPNPNGINLDAFLGTTVRVAGAIERRVGRIGIIRRDLLDTAIQQSWYDEPIDVSDQLSLINCYVVGEAVVNPDNQPYVLFAKATLTVDRWVDLTKAGEERV